MYRFNLLNSDMQALGACSALQLRIKAERSGSRRFWLHRLLFAALRVYRPAGAPRITWSTFAKYRRRAELW